jgi:hypothetical protein
VGRQLGHDYSILTLHEALTAKPAGEPLDCRRNPQLARRLLRGMADRLALATYRRIMGAQLNVRACSDDEVIEHVADLLVLGRLVLQRTRCPRPDLTAVLPEAAGTRPAAAARTRAWIKLQVVEDASEEPVAGVRLTIRRTDGMWTSGTTGDDGLVEVSGMESGSCAAICELKGGTLDDTLAVVPGSNVVGGRPVRGRSWRIARIEEHRVRSGETLQRLAAGAGIGAGDLAFFNWGTRDPEAIEAHICNDVGCTRRAGTGFVFDDSDEPGVLYIPKVWEEPRLATGTVHPVRVRRVAREEITGYVWVRLVTCFDHPLARIPCELRGGGRSWPAQKTSDEGEVRWEELPLDDYVLSLQLGGRSLEVDVPWVREAFALHFERVADADELLGRPRDPHGIQVRLLGLGHDPGAIDGKVGPKTRAAIEAFEERLSLPRTGREQTGVPEILADLFGA